MFKQFLEQRKPLQRFLILFFLFNTFFYYLIGLKYLTIILASKTLFGTSFYSYDSVFGHLKVLFFTLLTFLGHFALLALLPCFLILTPLLFLCKKKYVIIPTAIIVASICLLFLVADCMVFTIYHFHINTTILSIVFSEKIGLVNFLELSRSEIYFILAFSLSVLIIEILLAVFVWKRIIITGKSISEKIIITVLLGCLGFSYFAWVNTALSNNNVLAQQTPNWPLYNNILAFILPIKNSDSLIEFFSETRFSQPLFATSPLNYPLHVMNEKPITHPYNIVIIGIDTWRFDAMNANLTPAIEKFAQQSWQFTSHYSGGNSTQPGLFSLFYSLPSNYWTAMLEQKRSPMLIDALIKKHYQMKIMFSSDISIPPINKTIFNSVKEVRTSASPGETSLERDQFITNEFKTFISQRNQKQPFFAFLFYDVAHSYCQTPNIPAIYPVKESTCERLVIDPNQIQEYINHYKNGVRFVDNEVKQVLQLLEQTSLLKNTIVIITSDHGEEFDDNHQSYWGHGSNYTRYQVQTPLIVYWPGQSPRVFTHQTTHYDIAPTLIKHVLNYSNSIDDYSIGSELFDTKLRPFILVGSYINMGIIENNQQNMTLFTSGSIRVSDAHARNLPDTKPDIHIISQALLKMRQYFMH